MRCRAGGPALALLAASLLLGAVNADSRGAKEEYQWTGKLAAGQVLEVKGVNGSVEAQGTKDREASVIAIKRGRHNDPGEVKIEVVEHDSGVTLCAVYPGSFGRHNECLPGSKGKLGASNNDVKVDFAVYVPSGVAFVGRTVNGSVEVTDLDADVEAYTVNGGVEIDTLGMARAETVNGCILASVAALAWDDPVVLETVNGSITLEMPAGVNAEVQARTVNGSISTDFPLRIKKSKYLPGRSASGTLGHGGQALRLKTVNGTISLRSR